MPFTLTKEFTARFAEATREGDTRFIQEVTEDLYAADILAILEELEIEEAGAALEALPAEMAARVLSDIDEDERKEILKLFTPKQTAKFVEFLDSDDAVDILNELSLKLREEIIAFLPKEEAEPITELLHYEEDCAGGLMAKELIKANINWTVRHCIDEIKRQAEKVEKIYSIYVVNDQDVLMGRVSVKRILLADPGTRVRDIFIEGIVAVHSYLDEEEVADIMQKYDLEAVPVINVQGKLLGRITVDDILDVITEQAELDQQAMAGISENIEEDDSVWRLSRARLPWLLIGMVGGLLGAQFIGLYEAELALVPAMAFFIPLITATGGNVGIQSSTIIVQALADSSALQESVGRRLLKAFAVAVVNGLAIALVVFGANFFFKSNLTLATTVSIALFSVVMIASIMGTVMPIILDRAGVNPAMAAGPFITTANDLVGLVVYFSVAKLLLMGGG